MVVAFFTNLAKSIDVSINGKVVSQNLPRNTWTIIDKVTDLSQIINFAKVQKTSGIQIYSGAWKTNPPFGSGASVAFIENGRITEKRFDTLARITPDAIAEIANTDIVPPNDDTLVGIFAQKIIDAKNRFQNDRNSERLADRIAAAKLDYLIAELDKLDGYINAHFIPLERFSNLREPLGNRTINNSLADSRKRFDI